MVTLLDVRQAAGRIAGAAWRTPLLPSPWLAELMRADVWLKLETVQATGSFKVRGAANAVARLKDAHPDIAAVVTASAGNHGQAVALAAGRLGVRARVYLPATAPQAKRQALVRLGAEIIEAPTYDAAETQARADAARSGGVYISGYNHADVIAGAGTVALEMLDERPDLDAFIVPLGGGGLLSGTAIVVRALAREAVVIGAEAQASPAFTSALAAGRPVRIDVRDTLADGLAGNMEPETETFGLVRDLVDRVVLVPEAAIERAMRDLIVRERLVVEGAAATAVGAVLGGDLDLTDRRVGIILSGRNVDGHVLERLFLSGAR